MKEANEKRTGDVPKWIEREEKQYQTCFMVNHLKVINIF